MFAIMQFLHFKVHPDQPDLIWGGGRGDGGEGGTFKMRNFRTSIDWTWLFFLKIESSIKSRFLCIKHYGIVYEGTFISSECDRNKNYHIFHHILLLHETS